MSRFLLHIHIRSQTNKCLPLLVFGGSRAFILIVVASLALKLLTLAVKRYFVPISSIAEIALRISPRIRHISPWVLSLALTVPMRRCV